MILQMWLQELRTANTEAEVVAFARSQLARLEASGNRVKPLQGHTLADGEDVREIASELAHAPRPDGDGADSGLMQQMLVLFSLATDRLTQLDAYGAAKLSPRNLSSRGGGQQRP
jgi:hypothetical protein